MSAIAELVIELAAECIWNRTIAKWPMLADAVALLFLVIGLIVGLWFSGADHVQALTVCVLTGILFAALLFYRARRKSRAASMPAE